MWEREDARFGGERRLLLVENIRGAPDAGERLWIVGEHEAPQRWRARRGEADRRRREEEEGLQGGVVSLKVEDGNRDREVQRDR